MRNLDFETEWSDKTKSVACYGKDDNGRILCKCVIRIDMAEHSWTITSWFTDKTCQHQGIGKTAMKEALIYGIHLYGSPEKLLYTWNGSHQYVMDYLVREFDARCACPIAVQKKLEGEDIWEAHIYELNKEKVFAYFHIEGDE